MLLRWLWELKWFQVPVMQKHPVVQFRRMRRNVGDRRRTEKRQEKKKRRRGGGERKVKEEGKEEIKRR